MSGESSWSGPMPQIGFSEGSDSQAILGIDPLDSVPGPISDFLMTVMKLKIKVIGWDQLEIDERTFAGGATMQVKKGRYKGVAIVVKELIIHEEDEVRKRRLSLNSILSLVKELRFLKYNLLKNRHIARLVGVTWTMDGGSDPKLKPAIILIQEDNDLDQFLRKCKDNSRYLTVDEKICALISGILSGIAAVHKAGLIHGDIKPQNILVSTDNKDGSLVSKISDFGLSIQRDQEEDEDITGTLDWKSPKHETKDNDESYSTEQYGKDSFPQTKIECEQAQDVWACGLVAMGILDDNLDPLGLKRCSSIAEKEMKKKDALFMMIVWIEKHLRQADDNIENPVRDGASGKGKEKDDGPEEDHTIQRSVSEYKPDFQIFQKVSASRSEWKTVAHRVGRQIVDLPINTLSPIPQQRLKSTLLAENFSEMSGDAKPHWDLVLPLTELQYKNQPSGFGDLPLSLQISTWPYLLALAEQIDAPVQLQHFIGDCYLDGSDIIEKNIPEGHKWLLKAAQNVSANQMELTQAQEQVLLEYRVAHSNNPDLPSSPPITPAIEMEWMLNSIILNQGGYWWTIYPSNQVARSKEIRDAIAEQRDFIVKDVLEKQLGRLELEKSITPETLVKVKQQVVKDIDSVRPKRTDHAKALEVMHGSINAALERLTPDEAKGLLEIAFTCYVLHKPTDHEARDKFIRTELGNDALASNGNENYLRELTMKARNVEALNLLKENVDPAVVLNTAFVRKVAHLGYDDTVRLLEAIQTAVLYFNKSPRGNVLKAAIDNTDPVFDYINGIPKFYAPALHEAVQKRRFSCLMELLRREAEVDLRCVLRNGPGIETPLSLAVQTLQPFSVSAFLSYGANPGQKNPATGFNSLHLLCDVDVRDRDSALFKSWPRFGGYVVSRNTSEIPKEKIEFDMKASQALIFELLVSHSNLHIDDEEGNGATALDICIAKRNVPLVRKLIDSGAKLDRVCRELGLSYLLKAIVISHMDETASLEIQRLLLQKNPGLVHSTHNDKDPILWSAQFSSQPSWNLLLDHGASPTTLDHIKNNILHLALLKRRYQTAALFLSDIIRRYDRCMAQSLFRGQNVFGQTPIHLWVLSRSHIRESLAGSEAGDDDDEFIIPMPAPEATDEAFLEIVQGGELLDASVVNISDNKGQTPLHYIVATNQLSLAEIFMTQAGAHAAARTKDGDDALAVAEKCGASEEMKTLLRI